MGENTKMTPAASKILETASHLFYWKGIHSIGVETIANEAGVTKKTLYDRFGSKDQLIVAYLKDRDSQWKNHLSNYSDHVPDEEPLQKILSIFDALENWLTTNNQRGCAFVNAFAELAEESHPGREVIIEEKKWLKQLFATYLKQLGLEHVDDIAERLLILHEGITVTYSMSLSKGIAAAKETANEIINANININN
ncbi:TetR/AcrR family transcriptional regulator [Pontibacillus yanchengensis]|uniref:TetR family transcriptional regulator n=1 Tax=Pontibacillus yanchengensis Y32 TaxID=1385514 RepID=A0A0A2THM4_9BACI|nr:TetR/AcrR family transcriptional regulator [Pontibacillus yanchengensis]KGP73581.1 TetR family transcriptional regulator [Pontibacillus yanchengensis Y32]